MFGCKGLLKEYQDLEVYLKEQKANYEDCDNA